MSTQHIEINHSSKWERVVAAFLIFAAVFFLARWLNDQDFFGKALTIIAVAVVHGITRRWTSRPGPARTQTGFRRVFQLAQEESRLLATWTGQGSRTVEVVKGLARGVVVVVCRDIVLWLVMHLFPAADRGTVEALSTVLVVLLMHLAENWNRPAFSGVDTSGFGRVVQAAKEEAPLLAMWLGRGSRPMEALKGLLKGVAVAVGKIILVGASVVFVSYWFAGAVTALFIAYLIIPASFRRILDKVLNPQRSEPATAHVPIEDIVKGKEAA